MRIKNKKTKANYVNYKSSGMPNRVRIPGGKMVDVPAISNVLQIINFGDFKRGFFEVVADNVEKVEKPVAKKVSKKKKKKKSTDSLDKVEKEVKDYTDNKE